jgi:hypothetical protein
MNRQRKQHRLYGMAVFWVIALLAVGIGQRWLRRAMEASAATPVLLERPLASLPLHVGSWEGVDVPMDARVVERAANDDFVNRRYVDLANNRFVDLFVAYTASPATMLGHRPDRCYPANGWRVEEVKLEVLQRNDGGELRCLIHRFSREGDQNEGLVVLNYYVLQGQYTTDADEFSGPRWRRPNLAGDSGFYVAQVQVVHPVYLASLAERGETNVKEFAAEVAEYIEELLPLTPRSLRAAEAGRPSPEAASTVIDRGHD